MIVPMIGAVLSVLAGAGLMIWGRVIRCAMDHDSSFAGAARMPEGAQRDAC